MIYTKLKHNKVISIEIRKNLSGGKTFHWGCKNRSWYSSSNSNQQKDSFAH